MSGDSQLPDYMKSTFYTPMKEMGFERRNRKSFLKERDVTNVW